MVQFWDFMDTKFRDKDGLVSGRLTYLWNYEHFEEAKSAMDSNIQLEQPATIKSSCKSSLPAVR